VRRWFHTGDRVVRDPDGHYRFVDRMKDSIRRRGENVSSWEVEQVLLKHPAIAACAIRCRPSSARMPAAAVQLEPGQVLEPIDVVRHCEADFFRGAALSGRCRNAVDRGGKIRRSVARGREDTRHLGSRCSGIQIAVRA
jgi:acyl-CoA synthetase (AMP-forming)/AMP-acid ligase II